MAPEVFLLKLVLVGYLSTGGVAAFLIPRLASPQSQESRGSENEASAGRFLDPIWTDEHLLQQEQLQLVRPGDEATWSSEGQGFPQGSGFSEELRLSSGPGADELASQRVARSVSSVADHAVMQKRGRLLQELARQSWLSALLQGVGSVGERTERALGPDDESLSLVLNGRGGRIAAGAGSGVDGGGGGVDGGVDGGAVGGGAEESRRRATVAEDALIRQKSKYLADVHRQSWINAIVRKLSS